jgi:hypothetical protein
MLFNQHAQKHSSFTFVSFAAHSLITDPPVVLRKYHRLNNYIDDNAFIAIVSLLVRFAGRNFLRLCSYLWLS